MTLSPVQIGMADVATARFFLAKGHRLADVAEKLGVMSAALDKALWDHIGISTADLWSLALMERRKQWKPDFD